MIVIHFYFVKCHILKLCQRPPPTHRGCWRGTWHVQHEGVELSTGRVAYISVLLTYVLLRVYKPETLHAASYKFVAMFVPCARVHVQLHTPVSVFLAVALKGYLSAE